MTDQNFETSQTTESSEQESSTLGTKLIEKFANMVRAQPGLAISVAFGLGLIATTLLTRRNP